MASLKSSPGSQNGTGLLQTVIAMKAHTFAVWMWDGWTGQGLFMSVYVYENSARGRDGEHCVRKAQPLKLPKP